MIEKIKQLYSGTLSRDEYIRLSFNPLLIIEIFLVLMVIFQNIWPDYPEIIVLVPLVGCELWMTGMNTKRLRDIGYGGNYFLLILLITLFLGFTTLTGLICNILLYLYLIYAPGMQLGQKASPLRLVKDYYLRKMV